MSAASTAPDRSAASIARSVESVGVETIRFVLSVSVAIVALSSGCTRLRLPAIDSTGSCLFDPARTTTLACPSLSGDGPIGRLKRCLTTPPPAFPTPVFQTPPDPPACPSPTLSGATGSGIAAGVGPCGETGCVASEGCNPQCAAGPRAVLLGDECKYAYPDPCGDAGCPNQGCRCGLGCRPGLCNHLCKKLPDRGKRGCILLTPQQIVAPVGGEVLLLSGICGTDGHLQMNEKLEWMLSPDSVGGIIGVGDDDPGLIGRLARAKLRPEKRDPGYAIGVTSVKPALITRGNLNPNDDVRLEKGQTWISLHSPSEGISRVTVLASDSECWDGRKATAEIYWVDARWEFPRPVSVPAETPVDLTTRVLRAAGERPATGWKVRYEIVDPSLATFQTNGDSTIEVPVDERGNATATIVPTPGIAGTAAVNISVIRPPGVDRDDLPRLTIANGQTSVRWSAAALEVRAAGPDVVSAGQTYDVFADVSNPGDQDATNVRIDVAIPPGTQVIAVDPTPTTQTPSVVSWEIGSIPAGTQLSDLSLSLSSAESLALPFTARADGLTAIDTVRVDVQRQALSLVVEPEEPTVTVGEVARFNFDITNVGDRPLGEVRWLARGDAAMLTTEGTTARSFTRPEPLQPGETWSVQTDFVPNTVGPHCVVFTADANGGQSVTQQACITAINTVPRAPRLSVVIEPVVDTVVGGSPFEITYIVSNRGDAPATNVRTSLSIDPVLEPIVATAGSEMLTPDSVNRQIGWRLNQLDPGDSATLQVRVAGTAANSAAEIVATAQSEEGSRDEDRTRVIVRPTPSPSDRGPGNPTLPPAQNPPGIPTGPLSGPPPGSNAPDPIAPDFGGDPNFGGDPDFRGGGGGTVGSLRANLLLLTNPVSVNEDIRYQLDVINDTDAPIEQIDIGFDVPPGVRVVRVVPTTNPELTDYETVGGRVVFPRIRRLNPGERSEVTIVLNSNQPQQFDFRVEVESRDTEGTARLVQQTVVR